MFFYHTNFCFVIKNDMEQEYNDSLMPSDFEQMAKAYSKHLKDKGFVFVRLEEEEFNLLLAEIFVLLSKVEACLKRLENQLEDERLETSVCNAKERLQERFGTKKKHSFECVANEKNEFVSKKRRDRTLQRDHRFDLFYLCRKFFVRRICPLLKSLYG